MAARNVVLDTSAVIALLCDEEGADVVEEYLNKAKKDGIHLYMSFATIAELFSSAIRKEGRDKAELYLAIIKSWPAKWIHSSDELCLSAGALRAKYKMSFADTFIASTAIHHDALLVHKDPEFESLKAILQMAIALTEMDPPVLTRIDPLKRVEVDTKGHQTSNFVYAHERQNNPRKMFMCLALSPVCADSASGT